MVHNHGLLHLDVKPNNVRLPLGPDGLPDPRRALLMDFGRADAASAALPPGLPDDVPERLASLLGSFLAVDPRLRPRSAAEVVERLAPATGATPVSPRRAASSRRRRSPSERTRSPGCDGPGPRSWRAGAARPSWCRGRAWAGAGSCASSPSSCAWPASAWRRRAARRARRSSWWSSWSAGCRPIRAWRRTRPRRAAAAAAHAHAAQEAFVRLGNPLAAERALRLRRRSGDPAREPLRPIGDPDVPAEGATVTMTGLPTPGAEPTDLPARGDDPTELDDPARELPRGR